jgi:hypothetical protein
MPQCDAPAFAPQVPRLQNSAGLANDNRQKNSPEPRIADLEQHGTAVRAGAANSQQRQRDNHLVDRAAQRHQPPARRD